MQLEISESATNIAADALGGSNPAILCSRGSCDDSRAEEHGIARVYNSCELPRLVPHSGGIP